MTKEQFREKIEYLLTQDSGMHKTILNTCMGTISSKMAQDRFLNAAENNFVLPKAVLCAVLKELAWQYEPFDKKGKKLVDEMKVLVKF